MAVGEFEFAPGSEVFGLRDALPVGTVLRGFVIEGVLGYGGYGVVYRARHQELGYPVAIKEYLPAELSVREGGAVRPRSAEGLAPYEDGRRRFLDEAKRIVQFKDDPGVVAFLDFFRANGTAYLVMEYVEGVPLSRLLAAREAAGKPLTETELRSLVDPLLETLRGLHAEGVLHRDIKPSNILVNRSDGRPVLIDFGAAKQGVAQHTRSLAPFTEGYAALEQVGDGKLGPWTDLYAVGAVMWRIIAGGRPPWEPPNPKRVELRASAQLSGKPDPMPSAVELGVGRFSRRILEAVDQCLMVREDQRTRRAEDLCDALGAAAEAGDELGRAGVSPMRWRAAAVAAAVLSMGAVGWMIRGGGLVPSLPESAEIDEVSQVDPEDSAGTQERPSGLGSLTIRTVPAGATVALLNGPGPYRQGMALPADRYEVEVRAAGHATLRRTVAVRGGADSFALVELRELERPPIGSGTESELRSYLERMRDVEGGEDYVAEAERRLAELRQQLREEEAGGPQEVELGAFTIQTVPAGATVALLDGPGPYKDGMALPADRYEVEVRADGHATVRRTVVHGEADSVLLVELRELERPPIGSDTESELVSYLERMRDVEGGEDYVGEAERRLAELRQQRREEEARGPREVELGAFTIQTVPVGATVALLNGPGPYKDGMALTADRYEVEVRAEGHATVRRTVVHGEVDTELLVELRELERPPIASGTERELAEYVERMQDVEGGEGFVRDAERRLAELGHQRREVESGRPQKSALYFARGSHEDDVLRIQGTPSAVSIYGGGSGYEVWRYGLDSVEISARSRQVTEWSNITGSLRVRVAPGPNVTGASHFTRGSHEDDVLRIQGTPSAVSIYGGGSGYEVWSYGLDSVEISARSRQVTEWSNITGSLRVR